MKQVLVLYCIMCVVASMRLAPEHFRLREWAACETRIRPIAFKANNGGGRAVTGLSLESSSGWVGEEKGTAG